MVCVDFLKAVFHKFYLVHFEYFDPYEATQNLFKGTLEP